MWSGQELGKGLQGRWEVKPVGASTYCGVRGGRPGEVAAVLEVGERENPEKAT